MCRRNRCYGTAVLAFGAGLLFSLLFGGWGVRLIFGLGAIALGVLILTR